MANRIHTFGCSFTYGQGFPDSEGVGSEYPQSKYAWPSKLNNLVEEEVVNHSWCGASGLYIQRAIYKKQSEFDQGDTIIVQWPFITRWSVIMGDHINDIFNMTPGTHHVEGTPDWEMYTRHFANSRHEVEIFCMISQSVSNFCELRGIRYIQRIYSHLDLRDIKAFKPDWYDVKLPNIALNSCLEDSPKSKLDKLLNVEIGHLPDYHLNEGAHDYWALSIRNELRRNDT